jgi:hypothetical protein
MAIAKGRTQDDHGDQMLDWNAHKALNHMSVNRTELLQEGMEGFRKSLT